MKHLTDDELIDLVKSDDVPEPSPLYWQGFAGGVNARIDAAPPSGRWFLLPRLAFVTLGTLAVLIVAFNLMVPVGRDRAVTDPPAATVAATPDAALAPESLDDLDGDEEWAVVRAAAVGLDPDEAQAQGLATRPGSAERLAMQLTEAELAELIKLLESEMKSGA